ncbi:hypothetical protein CAPTEDRAFT_215084 [Capitella teleta]|uniref:TRPM SLOG domain-containing protein n=1 Tax=Capitella teleta TaxID=283909 RepID=R7UI68_CAPTE|nr:hypothetical protein CAPTEDRAFT_215084 [Capitella teleta]|eukprot:ELU03473.1 hypothetical protein CAPTEDRAFT_215084 [Capitella teleta]
MGIPQSVNKLIATAKHKKFVRVDHKTEESVVWELLNEYWHIKAPKLMISVTGGAKRFFMKDRLTTAFKRGLMRAATTTGAWIITGGTNTGVMKFVGEAVHEHMLTTSDAESNVVALGIATWGIVDNRESLTADDDAGLFPAFYNIEELSSPHTRGSSPLDPNHTHFILVDNGTETKFGVEIKFSVALQQYISENMETGVARNQSVNVPTVLLVLEGGENTLEMTVQSVKKFTPIVIIHGSGRAADYIALAYRKTRSVDVSEEKSVYPSNFDEEMLGHAAYMFDWSREKDPVTKEAKIKKCLDNIKLLLASRRLITVFALEDGDTSNDIDQAILQALLKGI